MTGQEYINTRALHPFWDESRDPNKEDVIDAFEQGKAEGVKEGKEQAINTIRKEVKVRLGHIHTGLDYSAEIELNGLLSFLDTI